MLVIKDMEVIYREWVVVFYVADMLFTTLS